MKGYNKKISDVYVLPLPYLLKELPPLIPHNPLSVLAYLWALATRPRPIQTVHLGRLIHNNDNGEVCHGVGVSEPESANALWQQGFFGKGTLSRSEPSWFGRTARRLGLDGGEMTLEELTEMRRAKRRMVKKERELVQQQELIDRLKLEGKPVPANLLASMESASNYSNEATMTTQEPMRQEDRDLVLGDTIKRIEYLHLSPCEAIFLSLGLGVLSINDDAGLPMNTQKQLSNLLSTPQLWREYIVYHYLRSLHWCVRSGVKFGVDWLLYRKGPPFQHAEFAILVLNSQSQLSWAWFHSNLRVVGSAKKTLMFAYVEGPESMPDWSKVNTVRDFRAELEKYTVKPVTFSRFAPSRNRD